jgi:hypothetical protein
VLQPHKSRWPGLTDKSETMSAECLLEQGTGWRLHAGWLLLTEGRLSAAKGRLVCVSGGADGGRGGKALCCGDKCACTPMDIDTL